MARSIADRSTGGGEKRAQPAWMSWYFRNERPILGIGGVVLFFALWEAIGRSGWVNMVFISMPSAVFGGIIEYAQSGEMWSDLGISGLEFVIGYFLAVAVGVPFGIALGWYPRLNMIFDPFISFLYSAPRVALLPLLIIWLGIGLSSKVALIFTMAFVPIVVNASAGVRTIDNALITVARSFNASDWQLFRTVILPGSVPSIIAGLRLGIGLALIGIVVGELYAANAGIGYRIMEAGTLFKTHMVFAGVLIIGGSGVVLSEILARIERHFDKWRPTRGG